MPHKHRRDKSKADASTYDLPPSKFANALPVKGARTNPSHPSKRKHAAFQDDTPRAFTRLLRTYRPPRSGLDDGTRRSKTTTATTTTITSDQPLAPPPALPAPTILPNEPLSAFNARVDAALPFSGLSKKSGGNGVERGKQTKTERKMQRMQREWREEERRLREKREEEGEEAMGEDGEEEVIGVTGKKKGKKRRKGGREIGMENDDDEDPWAHIKAKRIEDGDGKVGGGGLVGLHDVVLAPPKFSRVPKGKENFGVGKGVVGLKKREELSEARRTVVEGYRLMMRERRGEGGSHVTPVEIEDIPCL